MAPPRGSGKRKGDVLQSINNFAKSKTAKTSVVPAFHIVSRGPGSGSQVTHDTIQSSAALGLPDSSVVIGSGPDIETADFEHQELPILSPSSLGPAAIGKSMSLNGVQIVENWLNEINEGGELATDELSGNQYAQPETAQRVHAHPMDYWCGLQQTFLDELCRLDGRGSNSNTPKCPLCGFEAPTTQCKTCLSTQIYCATCIVKMHHNFPFHRVQRWSPEKKMFISCSLASLGLRIQLNHCLGEGCPNREPAKVRDEQFVIIDVDGIHQVNLDFCGCFGHPDHHIQLLRSRLWPATAQVPATAMTFQALDHLELLSFESKLSIHDWHDALCRRMDNTGLADIPDRKEEVRRMLRQWSHIHMLKRSGRGHDPAGIDATSNGSCAVLCPACPQPGKNLPEVLSDVPEELRSVTWRLDLATLATLQLNSLPFIRWLYSEYIGLDANFRSKRKNVSTDERDPALSDGYAYFVTTAPYKEYLDKWKDEKQPKSTCVSHDAVNSANTKDTKGFIVSGIGAVDDIRHGFKRANATGDLQKGEQYINMDYLFHASHSSSAVPWLFVSYDIACQYSCNFSDRMLRHFPSDSPLNGNDLRIRWLVPKFHLPAHIPRCQWSYSFNFVRFVGRTEGEALERNWPELNRLSSSTKEMGPGARYDTMNQHIGDANWRKVTQMGTDLLMRMKAAIPEAAKRYTELCEMEESLVESYSSQLGTWRSEMMQWERDPTLKSPFQPHIKGPTMADMRLRLAEDEQRLATDTSISKIECDVSPTALITMGLELEELQARLRRDIEELGPHATSTQRAHVLEQSNTLYSRIKSWIGIQAVYIPSTILLHVKQTATASKQSELQAFNIKLWLPSELASTTNCLQSLCDHEWNLRVVQALNLLEEIRSQIRMCSFLEKRKRDYSHGVREGTKSHTAIQATKRRTKWFAGRYEQARQALEKLSGVVAPGAVFRDSWERRFLCITDDDLQNLPANTLELGEGQRSISWIWVAVGLGVQAADEEDLTETLRLNWCRALSRAQRWDEEIMLLSEEMRRTLVFLNWQGHWWLRQTRATDKELAEGLTAYASKQAELRFALRDRFAYLWRTVDEWKKVRIVPNSRRWFSDIIKPKEAPRSIFT